jgi:hypothetical protein
MRAAYHAINHYRRDRDRNPILSTGVRAAAEPRRSVHSGFLWGLVPPLRPCLRAPHIRSRPRSKQIAHTANFQRRRRAFTNNVLVGNPDLLIGDYGNPILKPQAAEVVKKAGEIALSGVTYPTPFNQCWPGGVPYIFINFAMQMLQQADKVTILYGDHEFRQVRLNQPHPTYVTPSWNGDSVGRYEGDTLVIDTVGVKVGPFSMVDDFGTPHTEALHVVERYRLLEYEAAREYWERNAKANFRVPNPDIGEVDPNYAGKGLLLQFTVEDEGAFTRQWSATITYRRGLAGSVEYICAENPRGFFAGKDSAVPHADMPDF